MRKDPRLPEAFCDPSCAGLCKAPYKPWCSTCGHVCVLWWTENNPDNNVQLELPLILPSSVGEVKE